jgi:hypothetical protein
MKKIAFVGIPMFLLLLVGCGQTSEKPGETVTTNETEIAETTQTSDSSKAESSMNTTTEESTTAETNASTSSVESETTNTSSVTETESSETTASNEETQTDAMTQLQMNFPTIAFPTNVPHTQGNVVNVASSGDENQLSVLYYDMSTPMILNKQELNYETPIAGFQQSIYPSETEAKIAVELRVDMSGQPVDLGYNITGYQQGAAGSSYVAWKEGNWNLLVRANNLEQQDPVAMAKQVVEYLEVAMLPAPQYIGQITIDMGGSGYETNLVTWQVNNVVYTINHQDAMAALQMAVSTLQ